MFGAKVIFFAAFAAGLSVEKLLEPTLLYSVALAIFIVANSRNMVDYLRLGHAFEGKAKRLGVLLSIFGLGYAISLAFVVVPSIKFLYADLISWTLFASWAFHRLYHDTDEAKLQVAYEFLAGVLIRSEQRKLELQKLLNEQSLSEEERGAVLEEANEKQVIIDAITIMQTQLGKALGVSNKSSVRAILIQTSAILVALCVVTILTS